MADALEDILNEISSDSSSGQQDDSSEPENEES